MRDAGPGLLPHGTDAPTLSVLTQEMPLAREQRKLAAIVAADVVGYSRLMGRDESGTLARRRPGRRLAGAQPFPTWALRCP